MDDRVGNVNVDISARLSVDDKTFNMCMNLIAVYAENHNMKGMVIKFDNDTMEYNIMPLMTDEDVEKSMYAKFKEG